MRRLRQTGRLCRVYRGTVGRLGRLAGGQARDLHDELVALSPPPTREVQFDEKWAFIDKEEAKRDPLDRRKGDTWDHVAFDAESRLVVLVRQGLALP